MAHEVTDKDRRTVKALSGVGVDVGRIALILDISPDDLKRLYAKELAVGAAEAHANVMKALYAKAQQGDTTAADLWRRMQPGFYG